MHAAGDDADKVLRMGMGPEGLAHIVGGQGLEATMAQWPLEGDAIAAIRKHRCLGHPSVLNHAPQ
jgi:hypothetical protein